MPVRNARLRAALLCATAFSSAGAAAAQATPELETLVVTAQLREQDPIEVPMAVTAYTGETLERLGVQEFEELSLFVPGFEVQNQSPNNPGFVMRGITSDSGEATNEPRVSVFQDGVTISKSRGSYVELFDLERIEVAKGPQSTLYGRGALIGAVNLIQNKAHLNALEASARVEGGTYDYALAEAVLNAPLGGTAALRLSGRLKSRDGYVENLLGGRDFNATDTKAVRASLGWEPSDIVRFDLIANYQKDQPTGSSFKSLAYTPTDPATGAVIGAREPYAGAALAPGSGFENKRPLGLDREVWGVTGLARWRLSGSLTLNSATAYRRFHSLEILDADGLSLPALTGAEDARGEQFSQDLRINYDAGGRFSGFVGLSYFEEDGSQRAPAQFDERLVLARLTGALSGAGLLPGHPADQPAPLQTFGSIPLLSQLLQAVAGASGVALPAPLARGVAANLKPAHLETSTNFGETRAWDLFADATYRPTDRWEFGAGLRYTRSQKDTAFEAAVLNGRSILGGFLGALSQPSLSRLPLLSGLAAQGAAQSQTLPLPLFGLSLQPTQANGARIASGLEDEGVTWRLTARYALTEDASLYGNYARGRRPKVLAVSAPSAPFGAPRFSALDAETVDSFEVGAKAILLQRRLLVEGALFHYAYENFQTTVQEGVLFVTTNAGEARSYGFEGQATWAASEALDLSGTYAYNHSRFGAGMREGDRFRLSPDHSLSAGATWRTTFSGGVVRVTPTYTWQSKVFFDDDNDRPELQQPPRSLIADNVQDEVQKAYGLLNLRVEYTEPGGHWTVGAFATNLLGENYIKDAGNTGDSLGLPTFVAGEPRFVGVTFQVRR